MTLEHKDDKMDRMIATGNTYEAKMYLKEIGMEWDSAKKVWSADSDKIDSARWTKLNNATYIGRKIARICNGVQIIPA